MTIELKVDFTPVINDIARVLSTASVEIQKRATYNALNYVGDKARTKVRKHVANQTSAKYGAVVKYITTTHRAHPNSLRYEIGAKGPAMPLTAFKIKGRAGDRKFQVFAWNEWKTYGGSAFLMRFKSGGQLVPVKRVAPHTWSGKHGYSPAKKRLAGMGGHIRQLWGPIIPKEMLRDGKETKRYLETVVPYEFVPRLEHEIAQAMIRAAKGK